ncbi:T6SS phospholipase effector Tle1-like catalytic domain-containing protein [Pseudomonas sp. D1-2]|uniref:T6SS phospholipase effector Tle1-like catalytic domain-containing protein n=1 Tax=unclassified Pseudomonas TaxID=196821 RepID=UPI003DA85918
MSLEKNNNSQAKAWAPPIFPVGGRLPVEMRNVVENYNKQTAEKNAFRRTSNARGQKRHSACCYSLHISLFFDGTNNNEDNDTKEGHPSNIAKLFHASLRGTPAKERGYFSYYMPGVGTPFPEIGELDYSEDGLRYATGGEDRINWALVQVASALSFALDNKKEIDRSVAKAKVKSMSTFKAPMMSIFGAGRRRQVMQGLLEPLKTHVRQARPEVLGVKLFVYGFSRGAAQARTFVSWLSQLFDTPDEAEKPEQSLLGLPVSIEFLGLLDTVASVGIAHVTPFFAGHMDWADDTQLLPEAKTFPDFVKCCRHFVAAFEQRACFPLDSVRNEDGNYPSNTYEVVYPGVHSDVGGGYPKNDQGKARGGTDELVSQIVLHDLYAAAFAAGAPLQVPGTVLPDSLRSQKHWRALGLDVAEEFDISPQVIERFNAWHHQTLQTTPPEDQGSISTDGYHPLLLTTTVEDTLAEQLGWITGWRIGRYANDREQVEDHYRYDDSYKHQPFFIEAQEATAYDTDQQRSEYEDKKRTVLKNRQKEPVAAMNHPGPPIYEPQIDQTQLSQAATEFKHDYLDIERKQTSKYGTVLDVVMRDTIYLLNENDEVRDHASIKAAGELRYEQLFDDRFGRPSRDPGLALLVALFDDHIHDSRAWFMHDKLASRELWAGYFFYRMTYFGNENSRDLSPVVVAGRMLGVAVLAGATVYGIKRSGTLGGVGGVAAGMGAATIGYQVIDQVSGAVVPFLPGAEKILQPTRHIGEVVIEQKKQIAQDDYLQRLDRTDEMLRLAGVLVEFDGEVAP